MGRLTFPAGSRVYVDTAPIIYTIEGHADFSLPLQPFWDAFESHEIEIVTSEMSLLETLVHPIRNNDIQLADSYNELLTNGSVDLVSITSSILRTAAELRATLNFKTPDAIHAATALNSGCDHLIANDTAFRRLSNINLVILSDLL